MEVQDQYVTVEGLRVRYLQAGSGPAMVLIHPLVGSAVNWEDNLGALATIRTVYALDLINMGKSERVRGIDAGQAATADRVAAWMTALGIEKADVAGASHGGAIAMMLAARHGAMVRRMVLFAPANPLCGASKFLVNFYTSWVGTGVARIIPYLPRIVHKIAHARMYGDPRRLKDSTLAGYTEGLTQASVGHVLRILHRWWPDMEELRARLPEVARTPTLLVWGDRDRAVSLGSGKELAKALGAKLTVLPGVGHISFQEVPAECDAAMVAWLEQD